MNIIQSIALSVAEECGDASEYEVIKLYGDEIAKSFGKFAIMNGAVKVENEFGDSAASLSHIVIFIIAHISVLVLKASGKVTLELIRDYIKKNISSIEVFEKKNFGSAVYAKVILRVVSRMADAGV